MTAAQFQQAPKVVNPVALADFVSKAIDLIYSASEEAWRCQIRRALCPLWRKEASQ
jgi:hypothetical protein